MLLRILFIVAINLCVNIIAISFEKSIYELLDADIEMILHYYPLSADIALQLTKEIKRSSTVERALLNLKNKREASGMILMPCPHNKKYLIKVFKFGTRSVARRCAAERIYGAEYLRAIVKKYDLYDYIFIPRKMTGTLCGYPMIVVERAIPVVNQKRIMHLSDEHIKALCILLKESCYRDIAAANIFVAKDSKGVIKIAIIDTEIRSFAQKNHCALESLKHRVPPEQHSIIDTYLLS